MRNFLLLVLMFVTTVANAATLLSKQYIGGVYYNFYDDGTAEVTYGTLQSPENYSGDIQIRSSVTLNGKSYTVTAIGEDAFYACANITSVNIPNTVKSIGNSAFYGTGITEIDIPEFLTNIGDKVFQECPNLKSVSMTNSVITLGSYAFYNCRSLVSITLSNKIEIIDNYTFYGCRSLKNIEIPSSVTTIGHCAFHSCSYLQSLEIPNSVTSIGNSVFYYCSGLKSIRLSNSLTTIGNTAFYSCAYLQSVDIPNSVTSIGEGAFRSCTRLENVTLPNSIEKIPNDCFFTCSNLLSVTIPSSVTSIGSQSFRDCSKLGSVTIPNSVNKLGLYAFAGSRLAIVYLCNDHISPSHEELNSVKKVVSCDNVQMPVEINYAFFYTGEEQLYNIPDNSCYTVTGNRRTEEGTQQVVVKLNEGFTWTNGTSDDIIFDFTIYPKKFTPEETLINAYLGQKLKDLTLPKGCKWMDDENTVLEYTGENTFSVYYTPDGWTKAPLLIEMTVMVAKIVIELPVADATVYEYDGKAHTYQFTETEFYKVSNPTNLTQTNVGTYDITIALKNKAKYMWSNGSSTDLTYKFIINKQTVTRPEADKTEFVYTGKPLTYKLAESPLYTVSNNVQTNIGSYSVLVSLIDQSNYKWDNGSSYNQTYSFIINKNGVKKPEADTRTFMYTGEPQTYYIPENDLYTVTGNVQTNVGTYTVRVALKDKNYYRWSDGTSNDVTFSFNIVKSKVVIPPTVNVDFTYTGNPQTYPIASNDGFVTVIGYDSYTGRTGSDSTQTNAGTYYVVLSLKDKTNSMWVKSLSDTYGSTGNQVYSFTIKQAEVTSYPEDIDPAKMKLETVYGKTLKDITLPAEYKWVTSTTSVGAVGEKTFAADYTPKDSKNYVKTRVNLTVVVKPQPVKEPLEDPTLFYYNAKAQKYSVEASDLYTVKNYVQTNVGTYDVTISLKDKKNYAWKTSGTSDDLAYKFVINKSNEAIFENGYNPNAINAKVQYGQKLGDVTLPTRFSWKYPETVATKIGDNKYTVIYTPSDPDNYNSVEVEIVVNVTKRKVAYPAKDTRLFVYNGKEQTYEVGTNDLFKVANNVQTNAGRYDVIVSLKDKDHYEWNDGTTDDIYQDFIIRTKTVEMPSIESKTFTYDGKSHSLTIPTSSDYTISGNKGTDAGRYEVSLSLVDKKNYVWENNTTADIVATFTITKIKVDMPAADNSSFSYTGEPLTYKIVASDLYTVAGNVQTAAGRYDVKVSLNNPRNYEWMDGTTDNLVYVFYIKSVGSETNLDKVDIPSVAKKSFVYDGATHTLGLTETDYYTVSDAGGKTVGRYSATLSLKDKSKYVWENGSSDDVAISYVITKAQVNIPSKNTKTYTYNATSQTYNLVTNAQYTISNNVQKNAGRYEVVVSLVDPKNYEWKDGTIDDKSYLFKIGKSKVSAPSADATVFTYNGKPQTYNISKSSYFTVSNNVQTNVGTYEVIVALADPNNYMWTDGSSYDLSYNFVIRPEQTNLAVVDIPTVTKRSFVYNGKTQTLAIPESDDYIITGNKKTNAGRYVATLSLRDPSSTVWSDGSKEDIQFVFNIDKASVEIPMVDHTVFVYNGKSQTYNIPESVYYRVSGNVQTKVGRYDVIVALYDAANYMWEDGTVDDLSYNFVVRAESTVKTPVAIPSVATKNFIYDGTTKSLAIATNTAYTISGNKGVDAGRYTVTLSLVDPTKTVWADGSVDDVKMTFTIAKAGVDKPAADNSKFIYTGKEQIYHIDYSYAYKISDSIQVNAGKHIVTVSLKDAKNYEWSDGSIDDLSYSFVINKAQVEIPAADNSKFIYTGKEQTYKLATSTLYTIEGAKQTMPGKYEVLVSLKDSKNYEWENGTIEALSYNFVIRAQETELTPVAIPSVATKKFIYDGTTKSLAIASNTAYTISGNKGVDAGRYTVTLTLTDPTKTVWADGSVDDVKMTFTIAKAQVGKPAADNSKFVYDGTEQIYSIDDKSYYTAHDTNQVNAGKHVVTVSLNDAKNYEWSDGSIDDLTYIFVINKAQVEIPAADNSKFVYTGKEQTYKLATSTLYIVEGNKQTMPGKYEVLVSLKDSKNYEWENGTTEALSYNFVIRAQETELTPVAIPSVATKNFIYDGTTKSLAIATNTAYTISGNKGVDAGRYTVTLSLTDPTKTVWTDGSVDDVKMTFTIAKAQVVKPAADKRKFVYNGKEHEYFADSYNGAYTINNNIQVEAGRYEVSVSLNDAKNYEWSDGSIDDLTYNFVINKAQVEIPAADNSKFIYNGKAQTYKLATSTLYTIEGNKQTMPGKYEVLVSLKDSKNYEWENGTTEALSYNFVIRAQETELTPVAIPSVATKNFIYDGTTKSLAIASNSAYTISGNKGVDAGRYTVTLSLTDPTKTVWADGSVDDVKMTFTIAKAQVVKPAADNRKFIYTGKAHSYHIDYSYAYKISDSIQVNAGKHVVTVSLNDVKNYEWSDGTIDDLAYSFVINKAQVEIPAADNSKFIYTGKEQTYKLATSTLYTVEGNKQTMPGKYEVLVSLKDSKNYEWENGTTEALSYNFVIRAQETELTPVAIPSVVTKNFIYDGTTKSLAIATNSAYTISGNKGVDAGRYTVTLSLVDPTKTVWADGSVDDVKMTFTIAKAQVDKPAADNSKFVYDGTEQIYSIKDKSYYTAHDTNQVNAGKHVVSVSLNDVKNYEWSDGTIDDLTYSFVINKAQVEIPAADNSKFIYTGKEQTYKLATSTLYTIEGNKQTMPGKYEVLVSLKDSKNYEWENGTIEALSYNFVIRAQETELTPVAIPSVATKNFIYDGTTKSLAIASNSAYTISGNKGVDAGRYTVTLSLTDPTKTVWADGSVDDVKMTFTIAKAQVEIPAADDSKFVYTGDTLIYNIAANSHYIVEGNKQSMLGNHLVYVSLVDPKNYEWENGTIDMLSYNFVIRAQETELTLVAIPTVSTKDFIYDGDVKRLKIVSNDYYKVSGNEGVDAGRYTVTLSLVDPTKTVWADGSVDDVKISFTINKAQVEIPTADNSKFVYNRRTQTYKVAANDAYTVSGNNRTNAGYYIVNVALNDTKNYMWTDGTTEIQKFNFVIAKAQVVIPAADNTVYIYDGYQKTYKIEESSLLKITGNKQTLPGKYEVRVALADMVNYEWNDGTTSELTYNFVIRYKEVEKKSIMIPTVLSRTFTYDGEVKSLPVENPYYIDYYTISGNEGTNAGRYVVTLSLKNPDETVWSDGSTEDIKMTFTINKAQVEIPAADNSKFVYNGKTQTYKLAEDSLYTIDGNKRTMPGKYEVLVSLNDSKNYEWENGTNDILTYNFVIRAEEVELKPVEIPTVSTKKFIYDGKAKSLAIDENDAYTVSNNRGVNAGRYVVTLSLNDPTKTVWSDGSTDDVKMSFTIAKAQVEIPAADPSKHVYNGNDQVYELKESSVYSVENDIQVKAGRYDVVISLNDVKNYEWEDGTVDDLVYNFTVNKAKVEMPAANDSVFVYNSDYQIYNLAYSNLYSVSNNEQMYVGKYAVKVSLNDAKDYEWSNGSIDDLNYSFVINKAKVNIPAADTSKFVYTADYQTYKVAQSGLYSVAGNSQINVGNHDVVISLNDAKNYEWNDGTVSDIVYSFLIVKQEIDVTTVKIPVVKNTNFTYDANAHSLEIFETDYYTVVGNTKTDAGKYVATVSLRDKETMVWEDGSVDNIKIPFVISKAIVTTPAADTTAFEYDGHPHVYGIPENPYYYVSGNVQSLVGRHIVKVSLVDYSNYMWSDGTSNDLQYEFVIKMKETNILPIEIPVVSKSNFIYNGLAQGLDIKESQYYTVSGNSNMSAGSYTTIVSLNDKKNTSWENGTTADLEIPYVIAKAKVTIPSTDSTRFVYSGDTLTYPVAANPNYVVSDNQNVAAGNYQAVVTLVDKANTVWENGSSDDVLIPYSIGKIQLAKPASDSTQFVYSGDTMSLELTENAWYDITDNSGVKAGKYAANVSLKDKANTVWNDGTTDDVVVPFTIAKAQVEIPAVDTSLFIYSVGDTMVYTIAKNEYYTIKGNVQTMVGRYSVVVTLNDIENYSWSDGTSVDVVYPFVINEPEVIMSKIPTPIADSIQLVYNGEMQTFNIFADSNCVVSGNVRKDAGKYLATVSLADRNTMIWENGTSEDITIPFSIAKAQVEIPAVDSTVFEFNGEEHTYYIPEDSLYTIEGNVQTNVGRYDVYISLIDINNYEWSNGSTVDVAYRFSIIHPIVKDTINPEDIKISDESAVAGDTINVYDKPGDYIYDITYDSLAHKQGFEDVKAEAGDSGISIVVPEDAKPGNYDANVTITDIDGTVIDTTLQVQVSYPSSLIVRMMADLLIVDNSGKEFVSYQWYKNGKKIDGATEQFYCDVEGVNGVYKVEVVNFAGDTLFIAEHEFKAIASPFNITLSRNPVNAGEDFTVTIEGVTDMNVLSTSSIVVYNMKGVAVINKMGIDKVNTLSVYNIGEYIVVARVAGQVASKHLLVK